MYLLSVYVGILKAFPLVCWCWGHGKCECTTTGRRILYQIACGREHGTIETNAPKYTLMLDKPRVRYLVSSMIPKQERLHAVRVELAQHVTD